MPSNSNIEVGSAFLLDQRYGKIRNVIGAGKTTFANELAEVVGGLGRSSDQSIC
jgi:hypothetical protein